MDEVTAVVKIEKGVGGNNGGSGNGGGAAFSQTRSSSTGSSSSSGGGGGQVSDQRWGRCWKGINILRNFLNQKLWVKNIVGKYTQKDRWSRGSPNMKVGRVHRKWAFCFWFLLFICLHCCCLSVEYCPLGQLLGATNSFPLFWPGIPAISFGSAGSNLQQNWVTQWEQQQLPGSESVRGHRWTWPHSHTTFTGCQWLADHLFLLWGYPYLKGTEWQQYQWQQWQWVFQEPHSLWWAVCCGCYPQLTEPASSDRSTWSNA